jgi:hypothetical protein
MLDIVFLATFAVLVAMSISIYLVKRRRRYRLHSRIQLILFVILMITVTAFEIELQLFTDWRKLAAPSPYMASGWVDRILAIHLCFSIPTPLLWLAAVVLGFRWFGWAAEPNANSRKHQVLGWTCAVFTALTTVTGWIFYYMAFVAA